MNANRFNTNPIHYDILNTNPSEITSDGYMPNQWTWQVQPDGTRVRDKYVGPGPLINRVTGEAIERNRPNSPYIEADIESDEMQTVIEGYYHTLASRLEYDIENRHPYTAPESFPLDTSIEQYMLDRFLYEGGTLNIWDISNELGKDDGSPVIHFERAVNNFISTLGVEVKIAEDKPEAPVERTSSRRNFFKKTLGGAALLTAGGGFVAGALATASKIDRSRLNDNEPAPIFYPVQESDKVEGLWGIVPRIYPNLTEAEDIKAYIDSGVIVNETAKKDGRDPLVIWAGDELWLPQP